jgi:hypothetical protein
MMEFIKKNPTRCNNVSKFLLFHIYMKLNVFRATHRTSSEAALAASGFSYVWGCWTCRWWTLSGTRPTTSHVWKTRGCQCSFRLLIMGGVSPETCWASYKYGIIKIFIHFCILLDFSLWIVLWCTDRRTSCRQWCNKQNTRIQFRRISCARCVPVDVEKFKIHIILHKISHMNKSKLVGMRGAGTA